MEAVPAWHGSTSPGRDRSERYTVPQMLDGAERFTYIYLDFDTWLGKISYMEQKLDTYMTQIFVEIASSYSSFRITGEATYFWRSAVFENLNITKPIA